MGDLLLQALLSMLCGALMVMWLLKVFVVPAGVSVFEIHNNVPYNLNGSENESEHDPKVTPP